MKTKLKQKKVLALVCCLMLAAVFCLQAFALSPAVEAVIEQLEFMQKVDISPQWLPDIRANESGVQQMLNLYLACTPAERAEFTNQQNADLREYFEALYTVQGKDPAAVDEIFSSAKDPAAKDPEDSSLPPEVLPEEPAESSSLPVEDSSLPQESSSAAPSSSSVSALPTPGEVIDPEDSSEDSSQHTGTAPPDVPTGGGWLSVFGNPTTGTVILIVIAAVVAILFIRFLIALRSAGKEQKEEKVADFRTRELFGENYTVDTEGADSILPENAHNNKEETTEKSQQAPMPPMHNTPADEKTKKENWREKRRKNKTNKNEPEENNNAVVREEELDNEGEGVIMDIKHPLPPLATTPEPSSEPASTKDLPELPGLINKGEQASKPHPQFGSNPDKQNSITMRSFSAQPRTGKPPKQPFRQGSPDDLDAIDE